MNHSPDTQGHHHPQADPTDHGKVRPGGWLDAVATLVSSRIALIQLEARESARRAAIRVARLVAAVICLLLTWLLLVAGGIGVLAMGAGWPWHWLAIAVALVHLAAAFALLSRLKTGEPSFPLTRAEFEKDRKWLENLKEKSKSGN